jgi:hypothetical protein
MNLQEIRQKYKTEIFLDREHPSGLGGFQIVFKFENGYGASLVRSKYTYGGPQGLFEMAVVKFNETGTDYKLNYDTPITDDVLGHLTAEECAGYLKDISELPGGE